MVGTVRGMSTWNDRLLDQLTYHWGAVRPRFDSLTDEEYRWEPVEGAWNVRRREEATAPMAAGAGEWVVDFAFPEPTPPPVTTIAWRMAHIIVGIFAMRNASHFGGPPADYFSWDYAGDAKTAVHQLDEAYEAWIAGVRALGEDGLERAIGESEGEWASATYAELVLHINREAIHHLAEIALLRDLYGRR